MILYHACMTELILSKAVLGAVMATVVAFGETAKELGEFVE
jgi:hypothetical protein